MKKLAFASLVLAASVAMAAEQTNRYIVTYRFDARPSKPLLMELENAGREIETLSHVDVAIIDMTAAEAAKLKLDRNVRAVELDSPVKMLSTPRKISVTRNRNAQTTPYGIGMVNAAQVWPIATAAGARTIKVGVIDTGVDKNHPDLIERYKGGYDFVNSDADPMDDNGHGTHVAGTIAATNNSIGVIGVAPTVELYGIKVLNASGNGNMSTVIKALDWAIENKLNVVNLSLGSESPSPGLEQAFIKATNATNNILAVAASGNDYDTMLHDGVAYPAAFPTVLAVGAINGASKIADFSQRGADLDVVAPGVAVLSTYPVGTAEIGVVDASVGSYDANPVTGTPSRNLIGEVVFAGKGAPEQIPAAVAGKIALIERGDFYFWEKVANAKAKGAVGVILFNREGEVGNFGATVVSTPADASYQPTRAGDPAYPSQFGYEFLPALTLAREDGLALKAAAGNTAMKFNIADDYSELQGTSMASPHVAGVAALIWSIAPAGTTAQQIRDAIEFTARDLGDAGPDTIYGRGVVDANLAARRIAPEKFPTTKRKRTVRH